MRTALQFLMLSLAVSLPLGVKAVPINFSTTAYDTHASAFVGAQIDGPDDQSGQPLLSSSASVTTGTDSAAADAIADLLFLSTSTEAQSSALASGAEAVAGFSGGFATPGGRFSLQLSFQNLADALGDGVAGAQLFVTLLVDGLTLLDQDYTVAQFLNAEFTTAAGLPGLLDITLVSVADTQSDGSAFNLASADFSLNTVPEAGSLALLFSGLIGLYVVHRRTLSTQPT